MQEEVKISKIQMPFWNMVWFIIKWTLASIVALFIMAALFVIVMTIAAMIMGESEGFGKTIEYYSSHFHSYHHTHQ